MLGSRGKAPGRVRGESPARPYTRTLAPTLLALLLAVASGPALAQDAMEPTFKDDSFHQPPDDAVSAAPLPPAQPSMGQDDETNGDQDMVPNPLDDPSRGGRAPAKGQPQAGTARRGSWVQMGTAALQALDKINARVVTLTVKTGDVGHFGSLDIAVKGCFVRPPDQPADATAFLVVKDQHSDAAAFTGWMVRSAPYMSMLANPIYDVRVAGCAP